MKVGGYAHSSGITFFNNTFKITSLYIKGRIEDDIKWIIPPKWLIKLENIPIIGGIVVFYYQWRIFGLKIKLTFIMLLIALILDYIFNFSYALSGHMKWLYILIGFCLIINAKTIMSIFRFHGAEHKVINCYAEHGYLNPFLVKEASRFNKRCGSNLVVVFLLLYSIMWIFKIDSLLGIVIIFLTAIQIMKLLNKKQTFLDKYLNILQFITVQEPKDEEISLAIDAFNKLLYTTNIYRLERLNYDNK